MGLNPCPWIRPGREVVATNPSLGLCWEVVAAMLLEGSLLISCVGDSSLLGKDFGDGWCWFGIEVEGSGSLWRDSLLFGPDPVRE